MNTNKTLADVQPGGRVRLGDQAELDRLEFQAWARELLPCPFCGNGAEFVPYKDNGLTLRCKSMGCIQRNQRTLRYGIDWLRTSMAEHWNTRALSAQPSPSGQEDAVHCGKCKGRGYVHVDVDVDDSGGSIGNIEACPHCAIAAPPSPGGQDALHEAVGRIFGCDGSPWRTRDVAAVLRDYAALAARQPVGEPVEMSPEFTDTARAAIAWVLWHHQGGSSPVGQPLRFALGMGQHDRMTDYQIAEAKRFAAWAGATTEGFHRRDPAQAVDLADFKALYRAYVRLLESGRDRIRDLGGTCDPVDVMEANDVDLQAARRVLNSQAVGNG